MQQLIDEQPYNDDYWNRIGTIQMQAEAYERALESSEYSLAINPRQRCDTDYERQGFGRTETL